MAYFTAPDTGKKYYIFGEQKAGALSKRFGVKTLVEIPIQEQLSGDMRDVSSQSIYSKSSGWIVESC